MFQGVIAKGESDDLFSLYATFIPLFALPVITESCGGTAISVKIFSKVSNISTFCYHKLKIVFSSFSYLNISPPVSFILYKYHWLFFKNRIRESKTEGAEKKEQNDRSQRGQAKDGEPQRASERGNDGSEAICP